MFVQVCVTRGQRSVHPTAELGTLKHQVQGTHMKPARCWHTVALAMIQSHPDLELIITERLTLFIPTEDNFTRENKQTSNSADLS